MAELETQISVLDQHDLAELPPAGNLVTVRVEIPPHNPGTPPHRHPGPLYGYMVEGEMLLELEGDPPRVIRAGETFWEPGGDRIHYVAANETDAWARFVVMMTCGPGQELLTIVDADELAARRHLRHPDAV